jgi:hypothetical protein
MALERIAGLGKAVAVLNIKDRRLRVENCGGSLRAHGILDPRP